MSTLLDQIGEERLRAVLVDFYDRVFADIMIGYMFAQADKARLIEKEFELTARLLGGAQKYTGKPLKEAHAKHGIFEGQFDRRLQILKNVLRDHAVDAEVVEAWIEDQQVLRPQIVAGDCK